MQIGIANVSCNKPDAASVSQRNISIFKLAFLQVDFRVLPISDFAMFDVAKVLLIQLDKPHLAGGSVRLFPAECNQNNSKPLRGFAAYKLNLPTDQAGSKLGSKRGLDRASQSSACSFHVCACFANICLNIFADV